jgi:hypothetical protein
MIHSGRNPCMLARHSVFAHLRLHRHRAIDGMFRGIADCGDKSGGPGEFRIWMASDRCNISGRVREIRSLPVLRQQPSLNSWMFMSPRKCLDVGSDEVRLAEVGMIAIGAAAEKPSRIAPRGRIGSGTASQRQSAARLSTWRWISRNSARGNWRCASRTGKNTLSQRRRSTGC